jgi:hypothetical protein
VIVGGTLVLAALALNEWFTMRQAVRQTQESKA